MTHNYPPVALYRDTSMVQQALYLDGKKCAPDFAPLAGARHASLTSTSEIEDSLPGDPAHRSPFAQHRLLTLLPSR